MMPALLPLALLEAVQNIDTPVDDGLGALDSELATKRLGLSSTVAAQVARYRQAVEQGGDVPAPEGLAVFRLVGRRPDADLVFADAGRRAARYAARRQGAGTRALRAILPGRLGRGAALRSAAGLGRRWLLADLRIVEGMARCEMIDTPALQARDDGTACRFYTAALAELLRLVAGFEGALTHDACRGRGDRSCRWRAAPVEGLDG